MGRGSAPEHSARLSPIPPACPGGPRPPLDSEARGRSDSAGIIERGNGPMRWIVCALALVCAAPASAQSWPAAKPITMVSPFPPGPPLDLVVRLVTGKVADALGQSIVVENRAGANGTIGSQLVARAEPDGYTLLAGTVGTHVTSVHLMKSLPYDPVRDFTPIAAAVEPVTCLVVNGAVPVKTVAELVAYAKARPGELLLRHLRHRLAVPPHGRAVQPHRRREHQSRALSRRRARHAGRDRRPHPDDLHLAQQRAGAGDGRPGQDPGGAGADPLLASCPTCRRWRKSFPRSRSRRRGSASSGRPDCPLRSSRASTARSTRRCARPTWSRRWRRTAMR